MGHCYANLKGGFASLGPGVEQRSARGRITGFEKMTWLKSENLPQMKEEKEERKNSWIRMLGGNVSKRGLLASSSSK